MEHAIEDLLCNVGFEEHCWWNEYEGYYGDWYYGGDYYYYGYYKATDALANMEYYDWYCNDYGCNGYSFEEIAYGLEWLFAANDEYYYVMCDYYGCYAYDLDWDYSPDYEGGFYSTWEEVG